ncbi:Mitochondrial import receptor subunit TOM6-like protein [Drosera capensis]
MAWFRIYTEAKEKMFGMFQKKPDKAEALRELKKHVAMFGAWVVVVRITPYLLHYFQNDELAFLEL